MSAARHELTFARSEFENARQAVSGAHDDDARAALTRASHRLASARAAIGAPPLRLMRLVPLVGSPVRAIEDADRAGDQVLAAGHVLLNASSSFPRSGSTGLNGHDLGSFHAAALKSQAALLEAKRRLHVADADLSGSVNAVLSPVSSPARAMRAELKRNTTLLERADGGLRLLAHLTAPDVDARLLLLSQDSLELRPTGGYIGSYGVLHFSHGTIQLEKYEATEDLPPPDPPLAPPEDLAPALPGAWGLSNANWWPDFPHSAAVARDLYRRQGGAEVDGVLALTEYATARMVGAVGPLQVPGYAEPVVEKGFDQRVVFEVELKRPLDVPRKKFLKGLSDVLFDRIFNLPPDRLPALATAIGKSVGAGDIQLWFNDPAQEHLLDGTVASGRLPAPSQDFLMLVDANLTASKANVGLVKQVNYRVTPSKGGHLMGHLEVRVRNDAAESDINPYYNAVLRVYAPPGSTLLTSSKEQGPEAAGYDPPFQVFTQLLVVAPQSETTVVFEYTLPAQVAPGGNYGLTWMRQPGTPRDSLVADVGSGSSQVGAAVRSIVVRRHLKS